jgi:hypothetical protein
MEANASSSGGYPARANAVAELQRNSSINVGLFFGYWKGRGDEKWRWNNNSGRQCGGKVDLK